MPLIVGTQIIPSFLHPLSPLVLTVFRAASMLALNVVILRQLYQWFSHNLARGAPAFVEDKRVRPWIGPGLGVLVSLFVYCSTKNWPNASASLLGQELGQLESVQYLVYCLGSAFVVLLVGFVTFTLMWNAGRLTFRFFDGFQRGYYGRSC